MKLGIKLTHKGSLERCKQNWISYYGKYKQSTTETNTNNPNKQIPIIIIHKLLSTQHLTLTYIIMKNHMKNK